MSRQPLKKIPVRQGVNAVIWENQKPDGSLEYPVSVERSYQDNDGNWQSTTAMFNEQNLIASKAREMAYDFLVKEIYPKNRQAAKKASTQNNNPVAGEPPAPDKPF